MSIDLSLHRVRPDEPLDLESMTTDGKDFCADRDAAEAEFAALREELIEWQRRLYAQQSARMLIVFQAMDAGGKDGATRKVFRGVNPQGVRVVSFKQPSKRELARDFLWRVHRDVPPQGMIHVFNRSHYEDVLIARVDELVPRDVWKNRYQQINHFERLLHDTGTHILKFYLHISKAEQRERFQARLDDPEKHWKFDAHDLHKRKQWKEYQSAYEAALTRCHAEHAPWYVIPADRKWYRNLAVIRVLVQTLRNLNPQYPAGDDSLGQFPLELI